MPHFCFLLAAVHFCLRTARGPVCFLARHPAQGGPVRRFCWDPRVKTMHDIDAVEIDRFHGGLAL